MALKRNALSGALVPIAGPDGGVVWQSWTYGELLQHLNNDLTPEASTADVSGLASGLRALAGTWIVPTLINAWTVQAGETVGYLKDALGFVWLRGAVATGASGATAFVLPAGYRPSISTYYTSVQASGLAGAFVLVDTSGNVIPTYTASVPRLNNVRFLAEL